MRILLFSGKGGVGKTSLSAATGIRLAELGYRTLVMSVDPAHSLADSFDFESSLFDARTADPFRIADRLWIHEVNIQKEIQRNWQEIWSYISSLLRTSGLNEVEAEEMAIFPGMEELTALLYVNEWNKEGRYDVIVLDCAPTGESLRFVSMPTTMKWYMQHVFPIQRGVLKAVRPIANRVAPFELPPDSYFSSVKSLFGRIEGIDELLGDPKITSVRLVTNAEKIAELDGWTLAGASAAGGRHADRRTAGGKMNKKNRQSPRPDRGTCLCQGAGPALSELLRRLGPPEQARRHFDAARVEFLKGLRALVDARIEQVSKRNARGEKISVE